MKGRCSQKDPFGALVSISLKENFSTALLFHFKGSLAVITAVSDYIDGVI